MRLKVLLASLLLASIAHAQPYPRIGAYIGVRTPCQPLARPDGSVDSAMCQKLARWPRVVVDVSQLLMQPNVAPTLRHYRPDIEIIPYFLTTHWYLPDTFVTQPWDKTFAAYWHNNLKATGGIENSWPKGLQVNIARKATADSMASLAVWGARRLGASSWFADYWWPEVKTMGIGSNELNDQVRIANLRAWASKMRRELGPGFRIYGNGPGAEKTGLDGTMIEGFPGTLAPFSKAITQKDGDWLKSEHTPGSWGDPRLVRFMLGTACMTGATVTYGLQEVTTPYQAELWFPEYAVDPQGRPDPTGKYVGWLGQPLGVWVRLASGLYVRFFEHGVVLLNPTGALITHDFVYARWKAIGSTVPVRVVSVPGTDALFLWGE